MSKIKSMLIGAGIGAAVVYGYEAARVNKFRKKVKDVLEKFSTSQENFVLFCLENDIKTGKWAAYEHNPLGYVNDVIDENTEKGPLYTTTTTTVNNLNADKLYKDYNVKEEN